MTSSNRLFGDDILAGQGDETGHRLAVPEGYVGEYVIPSSGRHVWWTGRVAIGLLYRRERAEFGQSAAWIQDVLLARERRGAHVR